MIPMAARRVVLRTNVCSRTWNNADVRVVTICGRKYTQSCLPGFPPTQHARSVSSFSLCAMQISVDNTGLQVVCLFLISITNLRFSSAPNNLFFSQPVATRKTPYTYPENGVKYFLIGLPF